MHSVIYNHFVEQEKQKSIHTNDCEIIEINQSVFDKAILDTQKRLEIKLSSGKCSKLLVEQITRHRLNLGERFSDKIEFYNASEILDVIELLEKNEIKYDNFKRQTLIGFSKVHHGSYSGQGYSVVRNLKEFWYKKGKIRGERKHEFQEIVINYEKYGISAVANAMHSTAIATKELKGEWLIFKQINGKKFYLCLASHLESDEDIFEKKISSTISDFPEIVEN